MADEPVQPPITPIERYLDRPVIYFDAVPTGGVRAGILSLTLACHVGEPTSSTATTDHLLASAHLRLPIAAAAQLRDMLDKLLLAATPTSGPAN